MQAGILVKAGALGLFSFLLTGCDEGIGSGGKSFQKQYAVAREALEQGNYARATRAYAELIPNAGPLAARLRLEHAHAELRAGKFSDASAQAAALARNQTGAARSAALAVHGTAEHELAIAALNNGDRAAGKRHLNAAKSALDEMLTANPELDPLGAMAGRQASIGVRLAAL